MTFKTLLLGSAAALTMAGAAQAADLAVAEPVSYVKVCDAFGPGYYYAPGTQTCLKISGYVRMDAFVGGQGAITTASGTAYTPSHSFTGGIAGVLGVTASSMTEFGPLTSYIELEGDTNPAGENNFVGAPSGANSANWVAGAVGLGNIEMTDAHLSLGPLTAGYTWSIFNTYFSPSYKGLWGFDGNTRGTQVALSFPAGPVTLGIAVEDYHMRDRDATGAIPDLVAALDGKWGVVSLHVGAGYGARSGGGTWGLAGRIGFALDTIAKGDSLTLGANYSANTLDWVSTFLPPAPQFDTWTGLTYWSAYGAFKHNWTAQLSTTVDGGYRHASNATWADQVDVNLVYSPVTNFAIGPELTLASSNSAGWTAAGRIRIQRNFP